ncbi:hypothetical protein PtB15_7B100 [Puccinia triticina]|nr:hypothetical protein PtB15_7B100 [Puccinia triticina]
MVLPATLSAPLAQPIPPPAVAPPAPLSAMLVQTRLAPQMAPRLPPWPAVGPSRTPLPPPAYSSQPLEIGSSLPRALRPLAELSLHASSPTRPRRRPPLSLCKPRRRPRRRDPLRISRILPPLQTGHVTWPLAWAPHPAQARDSPPHRSPSTLRNLPHNPWAPPRKSEDQPQDRLTPREDLAKNPKKVHAHIAKSSILAAPREDLAIENPQEGARSHR